MILARNIDKKITLDEYLNGELTSDIKHEYIEDFIAFIKEKEENL